MYNERLITAAAKWWGNTLRTPPNNRILGAGDSNVLDQAAVDVFSALLPKVPESKVKVFETELVFTIRAKIMGFFSQYKYYPDQIIVGVDYFPCKELAQAAQKADFDPKYLLPVKTDMWITETGGINIRHGVGAPVVPYEVLDGQLVRR